MEQSLQHIYDVFSPVDLDHSTLSYEYVNIKPVSGALTNRIWTETNPVEFQITDSTKLISLKRSYIQASFELQDSTANPPAPYANTANIAFEPYFSRRLFNRVECLIGESQVESTNSNHDRTCFVRTLMEENALMTTPGRASAITSAVNCSYPGTQEFAFLDEVGQQQVADLTLSAGFAKRQNLSTAGRVVTVRIPIEKIFSFATIDRVFFGRPITMRLFCNNILQFIQAAAGVGAPRIVVRSFDLFVCCVKPSVATAKEFTANLIENKRSEITYPYWDTWSVQLPTQGAQSFSQIITNISAKPLAIICSMLPTTYVNNFSQNSFSSYFPDVLAGAGSQALGYGNPFTRLYLQLGSNTIMPKINYMTLPSDSVRMYQTYQDLCGGLDSTLPLVPLVSYDDMFGPRQAGAGYGGMALAVFDCRYLDSDVIGVSQNQTQQVLLNFTTEGAMQTNYTLYVSICFERQAVMDANTNGIVLAVK